MKKQQFDETARRMFKILVERFGEPIGDAPAVPGVPDERNEALEAGGFPTCPECGGQYAIETDVPGELLCHDCGATYTPDVNEAKKRNGPSKKAAKSWINGTKKFKDKVTKAKKAGAKNPEGLAAWMQHKATGKWPSAK
jgi:hypothetical protein